MSNSIRFAFTLRNLTNLKLLRLVLGSVAFHVQFLLRKSSEQRWFSWSFQRFYGFSFHVVNGILVPRISNLFWMCIHMFSNVSLVNMIALIKIFSYSNRALNAQHAFDVQTTKWMKQTKWMDQRIFGERTCNGNGAADYYYYYTYIDYMCRRKMTQTNKI